ncbi:hypothetical protein PGT21_000025 [Puccinia graminis f. sp. tritici]|uniref:Uncharacterized protein n=1 Tax=Puccinia graminis f. sp. tritici TaxID=56615 RepID=A0A5B0LQV3_PUCGR|nr:hypothetical protein PGT21_000025 [Puccinia graminis f. sp. tritici]
MSQTQEGTFSSKEEIKRMLPRGSITVIDMDRTLLDWRFTPASIPFCPTRAETSNPPSQIQTQLAPSYGYDTFQQPPVFQQPSVFHNTNTSQSDFARPYAYQPPATHFDYSPRRFTDHVLQPVQNQRSQVALSHLTIPNIGTLGRPNHKNKTFHSVRDQPCHRRRIPAVSIFLALSRAGKAATPSA